MPTIRKNPIVVQNGRSLTTPQGATQLLTTKGHSYLLAGATQSQTTAPNLHNEWGLSGHGREIADSIRRSWEATVVDPRAFSGYPVTAE